MPSVFHPLPRNCLTGTDIVCVRPGCFVFPPWLSMKITKRFDSGYLGLFVKPDTTFTNQHHLEVAFGTEGSSKDHHMVKKKTNNDPVIQHIHEAERSSSEQTIHSALVSTRKTLSTTLRTYLFATLLVSFFTPPDFSGLRST